jgi:bifunctional DNA-binding transcriptional regulator/antitoxin component of YhaV-PrlF toxin-antitoxin module
MPDGQNVFVYHPSDVTPDAASMYIDPLNYTARLPESHFDTQVNDSDDDSDDTVKEFECHVDTRGYFHIPREATRAIGLTNGDGVVLESVLDDVLIRKASQGETPVASLQPVRGELRISDKAFIDEVGVWATVLNIKVANQTIVIS